MRHEFVGKKDWRSLDPAFLDQAPDGYASALSFFSNEAFHFYLPAYLLADLAGQLREVDVAYHLWHGLDDESRYERVNPRRYGERTWFDEALYKFAMFTTAQAKAITAYMRYKCQSPAATDSGRVLLALRHRCPDL